MDNANINKTIDLALGAAEELARYAALGDEALARQARATLNTICGNHTDGYPAPVRAALERAGLRSTFG